MSTPQAEGRGFLFPNKDRTGNQPNLTGKATVNGAEISIAAWKRVAKSGVPYLSLKFEPFESTESGSKSQQDSIAPAEQDDDLPF